MKLKQNVVANLGIALDDDSHESEYFQKVHK